MKMYVSVSMTISIAHRYYDERVSYEENYKNYGIDVRLHGHDYTFDVVVSKDVDERGYSVHTGYLQDILNEEIFEKLDHTYLNEHPYFKNVTPTMERVVKFLWDSLKPRLDKEGITLELIRLHGKNSYLEYRGE